VKPAAYDQTLGGDLQLAGQGDAVASIRRGLSHAREGAGRSADDVFDELEREAEGR
jgi:hypothetical protein